MTELDLQVILEVVQAAPDQSQWAVPCPGEGQHTTANGSKDARLYWNQGFPHVHCFHRTCEEARNHAQYLLKAQLAPLLGTKPRARRKPSQQEQEASRCRALGEQEGRRLKASLAQEWESGAGESLQLPTPLRDCSSADFLRRMFKPDDVIWTGEKHHSGDPKHAVHFRTVTDWCNRWERAGVEPQQLMSAATFKPGTYSRSRELILSHPYFVLEFDDLGASPEENILRSWHCIQHLREHWWKKIDIRAVVHSGNKSLHAWCARPEDAIEWEYLKAFAQALGADKATFQPAQPVRLPGARRRSPNKALQPVLWLAETEEVTNTNSFCNHP